MPAAAGHLVLLGGCMVDNNIRYTLTLISQERVEKFVLGAMPRSRSAEICMTADNWGEIE